MTTQHAAVAASTSQSHSERRDSTSAVGAQARLRVQLRQLSYQDGAALLAPVQRKGAEASEVHPMARLRQLVTRSRAPEIAEMQSILAESHISDGDIDTILGALDMMPSDTIRAVMGALSSGQQGDFVGNLSGSHSRFSRPVVEALAACDRSVLPRLDTDVLTEMDVARLKAREKHALTYVLRFIDPSDLEDILEDETYGPVFERVRKTPGSLYSTEERRKDQESAVAGERAVGARRRANAGRPDPSLNANDAGGDGELDDPGAVAARRVARLQVGELSSLPAEIIGAHQLGRIPGALEGMSAADYAAFERLVGAVGLPVRERDAQLGRPTWTMPVMGSASTLAEKGVLFKALTAGNAIANIRWLAGRVAGKSQQWLVDHTTLADLRGEDSDAVGVGQEYMMGCGATTAMLVRGAFDPVFSLQIRDRNDQLSEEGSQELAGRERALMEADGGAAERGGGKGIRVDDALNNQSSATGLEYDTTRDPSPREALDLIVDKVRDGMPVVVTIGSEPGKYAHYVTCLQIRTVEAGTELQFHNTAGGGETTWVPDSAVLNGALEFSQGSQVTAVDVPSAM